MADWDSTRMKSQLRLTAQKLGQLQDRIESQGQITRRDIGTLLQQGNVVLARAKAQKLMAEDVLSDLLQTLEMHVGVILGHVSELERSDAPSPIVLEASASIISAAPQVDSRDLFVVRDYLIRRLGVDLVRSMNDYVSSRVRRALSARPPSAARLDQFLFAIAKAEGVQWFPGLQQNEKVNAISELLDPSSVSSIDISRLRALCAHGLPDHPTWLRPKVWRLLLGTLPADKSLWNDESRKSRDSYYDLVRRLLEPFSALSPPTSPLHPLDVSLLEVSKALSQVSPKLMTMLQEGLEPSASCPLVDIAADDIRIDCAKDLDLRLRLIRELETKDNTGSDATPEIRLESMPEIRLDAPESSREEGNTEYSANKTRAIDSASTSDSPESAQSRLSTTLLPSRAMRIHERHASALLRLLYLHSCLNPANQSPYIASLLVPLYSALTEEVVPEDVAHIEADTFWLFEALIGDITELSDVEGSHMWARKISQRLAWADQELAENLQNKGLDPALPLYSLRWLVPLLTHTFPLPDILAVWDALLSQSMRERDMNPKLECLVDVCTSMLLRTRGILLRLGMPRATRLNLLSQELSVVPSTPLSAHELEDAFADGMTFLQQYPLEAAGGIENILLTAQDLFIRREGERNASKTVNVGLGARLRDTVWKGIVSQVPTIDIHAEDDESDGSLSEDDIGPRAASVVKETTLTARLTDAVLRGISNESAMEDPPSPTTPVSPLPQSPPTPSGALPDLPAEVLQSGTQSSSRSALWAYAEKLKESDAAATVSKVSTNWKVRAMNVWSKRSSGSGSSSSFLSPSAPRPPSSFLSPSVPRPSSASIDVRTPSDGQNSRIANDRRRGGSLPRIDRSDAYSPPARPAFFRPPRDSVIFTDTQSPLSPTNSIISPMSDVDSASSSTFRSLASIVRPEQTKPTSKSGPRPLLLNSASLITTSGHSRSPTPTSGASETAWVDSIRGKHRSPIHRESISSASSVSPSDFRMRSRVGNRSDLESDTTTSRIVPLRSSRSPMASSSHRITPTSSVASSPHIDHRRMDTETSTQFGSDDGQSSRGWSRVDVPDSPPTGPSPPPPRTPDASSTMNSDVRVQAPGEHRDSMTLGESNGTESDSAMHHTQETKSVHRQLPRLSVGGDTSDSSATQAPLRSPRVKSKRIPPRLANLRNKGESTSDIGLSHQQSLAPNRSDEVDNVMTPRALSFEAKVFPSSPVSPRPARRTRKTSGESEVRTRKVSSEGRVRKVSTDGHSIRSRKISGERETTRHRRDSSAVEGDDEGYNDLLSAYESEDNVV